MVLFDDDGKGRCMALRENSSAYGMENRVYVVQGGIRELRSVSRTIPGGALMSEAVHRWVERRYSIRLKGHDQGAPGMGPPKSAIEYFQRLMLKSTSTCLHGNEHESSVCVKINLRISQFSLHLSPDSIVNVMTKIYSHGPLTNGHRK